MKRLPGKRGEHHYDPQQVLYLIGNINYSYLHMIHGEVVMSCRTLKWFADQWPHFLRVHKKALINLSHITVCKPSGNSTETNYIIMADNAQFAIARRRVPSILELLAQQNLVSTQMSTQ
ncbi:LytTR family DNA-binding domain-containing protein [Spirosoma validum]|uniref:LytTR family transcriptional regulator DNA-binding domain-containing protein n=1 Tax=Spirosoma validum TaxID=2771355 RepID=A0A927B144_9BACT|nr:LytTR family DNA-binding domain-containing protein [Spirosoma validum]MBD2753327.1 LytTR family transcriptional regulator DNA-binding domain-containing protein [Spirosoma validum]